jgi:hypothetical protein
VRERIHFEANSLHETNNVTGVTGENFATSKMKLSAAQYSRNKALINTL